MLKKLILESVNNTKTTIEATIADSNLLDAVENAGNLCVAALRGKNKILLAGNGGSAADSQHIAAELVGRLNYDRSPLAAIALTTDTSALTAIGNDYGYEHIFSRQVEALGSLGDVLIAISTSGNSKNILAAIKSAKSKGIKVIGMTGKSGGTMAEICDITIKIPSTHTPNIQECHIMFGHIICQIIEDSIFGGQK